MMETLDRKNPPALSEIRKATFLQPEKFILSNGIPVYVLNAGSQEILKIDFVFGAGLRVESQPLQSTFTASMLSEGTKNRTASEIADEIDAYGGFFQAEADKDNSAVTLYTLSRYLNQTLDVVADIIQNASFPEEEFQLYRKNATQRFLINSERLDFLGKKNFHELLFGNDHPYGHNTTIKDYENISRDKLKAFFDSTYTAENLYILIAGRAPENLHSILEERLGGIPVKKSGISSNSVIKTFTATQKLIEKKDALQSVIMVGSPSITRKHPDFPALQIANSVLGGYFGSRLMSNIREDKGYTYGIGSAVVSLKESGYFYITTEVGAEVCSNALKEIYFELDKLSNELVPEEELKLVKNYLYGVFVRSIDGPFALAEKLRVVIDSGLDLSYYERYLGELKTITPEKIRDLYQKYLKKEGMAELVVGKL